MRVRAALLAAVLVATGCIDAFDPQVGAPLSSLCIDEDSDPDTAVTFAQVREIVTEYCEGCHTPTGRSPIGVAVGGLDLSTYDTLRAGGTVSGSDIVVPGRPCASALVLKTRPAPPFGARMPLNGPPFVDAEEIQLLADWVAEGARRE